MGNKQYDVVTAFEVIEHVNNQEEFLYQLANKTKPTGLLFLSTFDKTIASKVIGVNIAEDVLGVIPKGTHNWEKFIHFEDMSRWLKNEGFVIRDKKGVFFNPLTTNMFLTGFEQINYILCAEKVNI